MATIYVGNLPFNCTEQQVEELFASHGSVRAVKLVIDRETGKPRGFGFVEMDGENAQTAIEALNGSQMGGRSLRVNEARSRAPRRPPRRIA